MSVAQLPEETTIQSSDVPLVAIKLLTGEQEGVARSPGILTKEDVINIRLYVKEGLALPVNLPLVKQFLGYDDIEIVGLKPADVQTLFTSIRTHARKWDPVQRLIVQQGMDLDMYSGQIVSSGDEIISIIDQMPIVERVTTKLGDMTAEQLADVKYGADDGAIAVALGEILEDMKSDIDAQKVNTEAVIDAVSAYHQTLDQELEPAVNNKHLLMVDNKMAAQIKHLDEQIAEKKSRIEQLKKDYDKFVGLAFTGAAGGLIGLAITGGIFGDKAEKARKEKNKLIEEVAGLQSQVKGKRALQIAVEKMSNSFADLGGRMLDAQRGLENLRTVWDQIFKLIESSQESFAKIDDAQRLTMFIVHFKKVIEPWRQVGTKAAFLNSLFAEALAEYRKTYEAA